MAQLLFQQLALGGATQRAHAVLDQFVGPALLARPERTGARCALHLTQDGLVDAIPEREREDAALSSQLGPDALAGARWVSLRQCFAYGRGRPDRGAVIVEHSDCAVWPASPEPRRLRAKQARDVSSEGSQHVVDGRRGSQVAGEIGQALAEAG